MNKIIISLIIGVIAGIIDIIPGIIRKVDIRITLTGFTFWVVTSFIIAHIPFPIAGWLKGLIISALLAIPGTILFSIVDLKSVVPMIIITLVLGIIVGHLNGIYAQ